MKSRALTWITAMALFAALAIPVGLAAQDDAAQTNARHHHYKLVDMGTIGGPNSYIAFYQRNLNQEGAVAGWADTNTPDPNFPDFGACFNPDCLFSHGFQYQDGKVTDLGTLTTGGVSATLGGISENGLVAGISQNGLIDPITGVAEIRAVLWQNAQIMNLGTLGGNESAGFALNSSGQVVGAAANSVADQYSMFGWGTQTRAFLWQNGTMQDLGTLGGSDAFSTWMNEGGWVTGVSYTGLGKTSNCYWPIITHPFLWDGKKMHDLGTLGGSCGVPNVVNNSGKVVGNANVIGDSAVHPFFWNGEKMIDLGSFGGTAGDATNLNERGEVIGFMNLRGDQITHAFRWRDGELDDLETLSGLRKGGVGCSRAWGINSEGQIVGDSSDCGVPQPLGNTGVDGHAFLWEDGQMIDLSKLSPSGIELTTGLDINDRGQIAALGRVGGDPVGFQHVFLLTPADENFSDEGPSRSSAPRDRFRARGFPSLRAHGPAAGPAN